MRILIADDNADAGDSLAMILNLEGHEVFVARNGLEALEIADRMTFRLIFLDLGMPELNGLEACKIIRTRPWAVNTLVVAVTGWGTAQDKERTKAAGFDYHFAKPIEPDSVRAILAKVQPGNDC